MVESKKNLAWLIFVRLVVVSLFLASITYFNIRQPDFFPDVMLRDVTRLIIATYVFSILSLSSLRLVSSNTLFLGYLQIAWEAMFVSILVFLTGGISSTYSFFFNLAIINASFLFGRREAFYTAGVCGIIYGSIIDLHYYGRLERFGLVRELNDLYGPNHALSLIFTNLLAFFLTAILTGYLAERARKSESALKEKEVDYEELENLNSIIVSTLDSGLITVNSQGNIRVFNRCAAELTGISHNKSYDLPLSELFPEIDLTLLLSKSDSGRELNFSTGTGLKKILSLKSAPLFDKEGTPLGAVIDLKDITEIRALEAKLKKIDRLAAIGELSARIAHEVRNPLASISGSVQLIAESANIQSGDKKLLEIVLRETWRLNNLVSDFLLYARPLPLERTRFSLNLLLADLVSILKGDVRFFSIIIHLNLPENINLFADQGKLHQVLWNLFLNAAEAMAEGGTITVDAHITRKNSGNINHQDFLYLTVRDTGCGIPPKDMELIFEPFFTTKNEGTGLGLATVYRIIEAHGGFVTVEIDPMTGTSFIISLPLLEQI